MKTWKIGQVHIFAVNWQIIKYRNIAIVEYQDYKISLKSISF